MSTTGRATSREAAGLAVMLLRDPLRMYAVARQRYGDAACIPDRRGHVFHLLSRPEHAEHVLVAAQDRYVKAFTYRPLKAFLGDGLLTSEGQTWRRHRRIVQPVFAHKHVHAFAPQIVAATRTRIERWRPGAAVDVAGEMRALTMTVIGQVLFGSDLAAESERVGAAVKRLQRGIIYASLLPSGGSPQRLRRLATRLIPRMGDSAATLDAMVSQRLDDRERMAGTEPRDLLDLLLAGDADGNRLSRREVHEEVLTLVLAGHETTANTLVWTLLLLSRYPAARERLRAEVAEVVGDRDADADDMEALPWTRAVIAEAMRLFPPAWTIERDAAQPDDVCGVTVARGDTVVTSPYLIHRHPEFWPNPEGFDPSRFLPGAEAGRPRYAYLPFGGGRRICVGAGLAELEATLALATIAQHCSLDLVPGTDVRARAAVTLHPAGPVPMTVSGSRRNRPNG